MACGIIVLLINAGVLLGWIMHIRLFAGMHSQHIPMAPSTACLFLLLSGSLIMHCCWPSKTATRWFGFLVVSVTAVFSVLVSAQPLLHLEWPVDRWFAPGTTLLGNIVIGRMSPVTATVLMGTAAALLFIIYPFGQRRLSQRAAFVLSLAAALFGLLVLLSYTTGAPLLYGSNTIPMAMLTAVSVTLLNLGILLLVRVEVWLLWFLGKQADHGVPRAGYARAALATFVVLLLAITGGGFFYLKHQTATARQNALDSISAIADLKVHCIEEWRDERLSFAQAIMAEPFAIQKAREFLKDETADSARLQLLTWLESIRKHNQSIRSILLDAQLTVRLASPEDKTYCGPIAGTHAVEALRTSQVVWSDMHRNQITGEIHLDLAIPIVAPSVSPTPADSQPAVTAVAPVGVIVLEVDPSLCIFPELKEWPTPSRTGETLLVHREGNEVVYLSDLRHRENAALTLRARIEHETQLPAALAVQGVSGCVEGLDYRNVPVMAALRRIPGTPWFLVAKVDLAEFYAPLRQQAWTTGTILFVLVLVAALSVGLKQRRSDEQWLRRQLDIERDRTRAVESLRESEERFRDLFEKSPDAYLLLVDGIINDCNDAMIAILRGTREEILGLAPAALSPEFQPDGTTSAQSAEMRIHQALEAGSIRFEWVHRRLDGEEFWVEVAITTLMMGGKQALLTSWRDITVRKWAEDALRRSETKFRTLYDSTSDAVMLLDEKGFFDCNRATLTVFGCTTREEFCSKHLGDLSPVEQPCGTDSLTLANERIATAATTGSDRFEWLYKRCDTGETFIAEVLLNAMELDGKSVLQAAVRDITKRKQAEAELLETNRQLQATTARANMMAAQAEAASAAKSEFLANMSHEIRTPMTAILGYTDNLRDTDIGETERIDAISTVQRNGQHLLQVINDILDLSKIEAEKMTTERIVCSPHEVIAEVASLVRVRTTDKDLQFSTEFVGAVPATIQTDPLRLRQILINLIGNAIKFTHTGSVRLRVQLVTEDSEPRMQYDVIDTGIGMTPEQAERMFKPFSQADASTTRQFGGTGLGLVISKRLAQLLGGDVLLVETQPERGTRFRATVATGSLDGVRMIEGESNEEAVSVQHEATAAIVSPTDQTQSLEGFRILLVEDGPDNQRLIEYVLKKAGASVELADNGRIGMDRALAASHGEQAFDLILMDMQMPEMDGYEATKRLRAADYRGPIIALTAHAMAGDLRKCLDAGCDAYATKPIDRRKLIDLIASYPTCRKPGSTTKVVV